MQTRIAAVISVLVVVSGCRVIEPNPPPAAPRISSFTASKARIAPGEEVTLTFATTGATKVEITDDAGNQVELAGGVDAGTAKVAPTRSSFYVLRATGVGGRDTAFVQIAVNEPLKDVFLIPVPSAIESGQQAQLLWGAAGATSVTLTTGSGMPQALTGTTGAITVTPANTERYTLTAQGAPGTPPLTAIAGVEVRPVLVNAALAATDGIEAGKTLTFSWRTAGAARVTISEQTFGQLTNVTDPSSVVMGTFDYVLPAKLPSGIDVAEGLPLRFTVSAVAGDAVISKTIERVVGQRPVIEVLNAPDAVSLGQQFTLSWKTLNATQITVAVNGQPLFRSLAGNQARVDQGTVSLPAPAAQTEYTFIASNDRGLTAERTFTVRPVALPVINTFTLPGSFNALGDAVTARWTTANAVRVQLRFEGGATLATVTSASQVAAGSTVLTLANSARVTLEAANAAGDVVRETRAIAFNGAPAVFVTPTPVLRGAPATLSWTLAPASVLEVVGLPTPAPAAMPSSPRFIDLTTVPSAQTLFLADTVDGSAMIPALPGFRFPLLGRVQNELWVSVNGFIAFAQPAALPGNADLADAGNTTPSMLAPLWDDLTLASTGKVLYALQTTSSGESFLVVQWEKASLASDPMSELTFQAHLYETGQVAFIYKTVTGTVNSATIGVKDTAFPAAQVYAFNSTTVLPVADLELNFFSGGAPDGTLAIAAAGASRRIEFVGRTATGRIPASAELRSFGAGDVVINEVMPFPEVSVSALGQWIELRNATSATLDFDGLIVDTVGSLDGGFVIPPNTMVDAGALLVLGQSRSTVDTGGAAVNLVANDVPMGAVDRVRVRLEATPLSTLSWDAGTPGTSIQGSDMLVATGQTFACPRTQTFGSAGSIGTPGAANESCAPYVITTIPGRFTPAPAGSEILGSLSSDDDYGTVTLPQPFTYFGTPTTNCQLSTNGFISLGAAALSSSTAFNDTTVSTSNPNGVVAIFWDDLVRGTTGKNAMWRESDRTIITWEGFYVYGNASTTAVNVQVHLLDTGVLEFHYGDVSTTSATQSVIDRTFGSSATVWLERQDGFIAVPWSIERLNGITPNSGLRFTPRP